MIRAAALAFGFLVIVAATPAAHAEVTEVEHVDGVVLTVPLPGMTSTVTVTKTCWSKDPACTTSFIDKYTPLVQSMITPENPSPTLPDCPQDSSAPRRINGTYYYPKVCTAIVPGIPTGSGVSDGVTKVFFKEVYGWLAGIASIFALLMIVWGALEITTSGGGAGVQSGKTRIFAALGGLALLLLIGIILKTINPNVYTSGGGTTNRMRDPTAVAAGPNAAGVTDQASCEATCTNENLGDPTGGLASSCMTQCANYSWTSTDGGGSTDGASGNSDPAATDPAAADPAVTDPAAAAAAESTPAAVGTDACLAQNPGQTEWCNSYASSGPNAFGVVDAATCDQSCTSNPNDPNNLLAAPCQSACAATFP